MERGEAYGEDRSINHQSGAWPWAPARQAGVRRGNLWAEAEGGQGEAPLFLPTLPLPAAPRPISANRGSIPHCPIH